MSNHSGPANSDRKILVIGGTGRQGGAVAQELLKRNFHVGILTRDPDKEAAVLMKKQGAEVIKGDLNNRTSIAKAMSGVYGVFGVQDSWESGFKKEVQQGKMLIDEAKKAGVKHFVYNSVGGTDRTVHIKMAHFDAKREIEYHLEESGLPYTIFRPATFFENFITPRYRNAIPNKGTFLFTLRSDVNLQMLAVKDAGVFVANAFEDPDYYLGKQIELASDRCTPAEFAEMMGNKIGRPVKYKRIPYFLQELIAFYATARGKNGHYKIGRSLIPQFKWMERTDGGWKADIPYLRELHPGLMTAEEWVDENW